MVKTEEKSALPHRSLWITIAPVVALAILGGAALAVAVGVGIPSLPSGGPTIDLPATVTVKTAAGTPVVMRLLYLGTHAVPLNSQGSHRFGPDSSYVIDQIDPVDHVPAKIPVVGGNDTTGSTPVGAAEFSRIRLTIHGTDSNTSTVARRKLTDFSAIYYVPKGSGLPQPTVGELERLKAGTRYPPVTSTNKTVAALSAFGDLPNDGTTPAKAQGSWGWTVYFDLAALHSEGKTSMTYPLDWYANPFFRFAQPAAGWLCAALWLAALILLLRVVNRVSKERASRRSSGS